MQLHDEELLLPSHTEVVLIPYEKGAPYPGIFIFTQVGAGSLHCMLLIAMGGRWPAGMAVQLLRLLHGVA
jgi:hypothetical protein